MLLTTDGKKFYRVFRWDGDNLILDNSVTFLNQSGTRKRPKVLFGAKLVEAMDWIEKYIGGFYYTRGNLRTEADSIPDDVKKDWTYVDQYRSWAELWNYSNEGLQFSPYCDWRFVYLDESYQMAFGGGMSTSTPRVRCGTEYGHRQSSHGSVERDPSRPHQDVLRTQTQPISSCARRSHGHY